MGEQEPAFAERQRISAMLVEGGTPRQSRLGAATTHDSQKPARSSGSEFRSSASGIAADVRFLAGHGFSERQLTVASHLASAKGLPASELMIHRGFISRNAYLSRLANHLRIPFDHRPFASDDLVSVIVDPAGSDAACQALPRLSAALASRNGQAQYISAPAQIGQRTPACLAALNRQRETMLMPPAALRSTVHAVQSGHWMRQARSGLADALPEFSANRRLSGGQAVALVLCLFISVAGAMQAPAASISLLGAILTVYYFATVILRLNLLAALNQHEDRTSLPDRVREPEDHPVYSVLVALYDEANQVDDLVNALSRLEWPTSKLEVFLVCEKDDGDTIRAIRSLSLPDHVHLVLCPPSQPRTKPKALNYALPLCTGDYVVIYDAEDRPHPRQLQEAWDTFSRDCDGRLACLQAPLSIHNAQQNWLTAMFAIEYDTLFKGMLPILADKKVPMPLGGTSNHFRADLLRWAGGWDPYNVTEDADLGIRLARLGYRCGTLGLSTQEEAPARLSVWMRQRTRWLKGWMQTILVHMRNPVRTARDLGAQGNLYFHLVLTAIVVSMLVHPIFLLHFGWWIAELAQGRTMGPIETAFFAACVTNLAGGYLAYGLLANAVMRRSGSGLTRLALLTLPVYWLLISIAGWRAVLHLVFSPYHWEKTAHGLANSRPNPNIDYEELP